MNDEEWDAPAPTVTLAAVDRLRALADPVEAAECPCCGRPYFEHDREALIRCLEVL